MSPGGAVRSSVLALAEAVPLLHGVVDEVARRRGVRILFIKGPILGQQGLREAHASIDVDVLVDPARFAELRRGLEELGWAVRVPSDAPQVLPTHSTTYAHRLWPCEIDVHERFPGFLASPQVAFDALWRYRAVATVAGRAVPCLDRVPHFAVACLHALRDPDHEPKRTELRRLVAIARDTFDQGDRETLAQVAGATGAAETLEPVLAAIGLRVASAAEHATSMTDWRIRTSSTGVTSVGWVMELFRTPLHRWPATLLRAVLLTEAEIRDAQPDAAPGPWGLLRARLRRLGWGLRDVPRAVRIIRDARADRCGRSDRVNRVPVR
jgi:hypothetical protein